MNIMHYKGISYSILLKEKWKICNTFVSKVKALVLLEVSEIWKIHICSVTNTCRCQTYSV